MEQQLLRKIEHLENQVKYWKEKCDSDHETHPRDVIAALYFSKERSTWFLDEIGELPHVEKDGIKILYTDMYIKVDGRLIGKPADAIFIGEVNLSKYSMYTPEKYAEIWEKNP